MYILVTGIYVCYVLIIIILLRTQMYMQKTAKTDAESRLGCLVVLFIFNLMFPDYDNPLLPVEEKNYLLSGLSS